ncbi:hypothetical protein AOZ07_01390 [Glutamicibacter halophytocola]|nr:hypothetical protein AOZ07_01390 [Glutamicibacter halophytocola]
MPQKPGEPDEAPVSSDLQIPEIVDEHYAGWTANFASIIPESNSPATALIRVLVDSSITRTMPTSTRTIPTRVRRPPEHLLAERIDHWFECVRTWVEVLTAQDLDPNHRVYDAEALGAGLTFIEPKRDGPIIMRFGLGPVIPIRHDQWQEILTAVEQDKAPPLEHTLLRDGRAAINRKYYRRAVIDAAAAVEIALLKELKKRSSELPESQRKRLKNKPTLGAQISIAKDSQFTFKASYKDLKILADTRNDVIHRAEEPDYRSTHAILTTATDIVREINPL